jgi:hypothetical protein
MNAMGPPIICEPIFCYSIGFGFAVYRSNIKIINQNVKHISTNVQQVSPLDWLWIIKRLFIRLSLALLCIGLWR